MPNSILRRQATPPQALALGFAVVILIGAFLLTLPVSTASRKGTPFIDALYTSTSAACVTGLIVLDTPEFFSRVGQVIILLLIQIGGLGYMTMASMIALTVGRRISLRERILLRDSLSQLTMEGLIRFVKRVLWITFIVEALGAVLLTFHFLSHYPLRQALFAGIFHSVSAFCNAGFSVFSTNLQAYVADPLVNLVITSNIILGGIGYLVIVDLYEHSRSLNKSRLHLSLHTKLVLTITGSLIVAGTICIYLFESQNSQTLGPLPFSSQLLASYFHAVTPRTAGYNTLQVGSMTQACLFFTIFLMFVGASPGGTGGGIKTTTLGTLVATTWSNLRGRKDVNLFRRRISPESIEKAFVLTFLSLLLIASFSILLLVIEKQPLLPVLFEEISAFGTVGLSSGAPGSVCSLSAIFSSWGKLLIVLTMFAGRVGPITVGAAVLFREPQGQFRYVEEKVLVG
jgi:trk system potassium uptake protein TrkH